MITSNKIALACLDGGICRHKCLWDNCFRAGCCDPLPGVFPGDKWPDTAKFDLEKHVGRDRSGERWDVVFTNIAVTKWGAVPMSGEKERADSAYAMTPQWEKLWEKVIGPALEGGHVVEMEHRLASGEDTAVTQVHERADVRIRWVGAK